MAVLTTGSRTAIVLARCRLEGAGIPHAVKDDIVQDLFQYGRIGVGYNFITGPPEIMVRPEDYAAASDLLEGLESACQPHIPMYLRVLAAADLLAGLLMFMRGAVTSLLR